VVDDAFYAFLIGFGAYKLTEFYKEIVNRIGLHQLAWWKSMVCLLICAVLVLFTDQSYKVEVLTALAAAGFAAIIHAVDTAVRSYRDDLVTQVMSRSRNSRR
jgi:hypothetical protein